MELRERLVFCKQCEKRKFENKSGIICSLTSAKPDFEGTCPEFKKEFKAAPAASAYVMPEDKSSSKGIWIAIGLALIVIKIVLRIMHN